MPFLGMAASVVVVVQVLVMDFSGVLALDSLFQAGLFVVFLFSVTLLFPLRLSPLLPRNVSSASNIRNHVFFSLLCQRADGRPQSACARMLPPTPPLQRQVGQKAGHSNRPCCRQAMNGESLSD